MYTTITTLSYMYTSFHSFHPIITISISSFSLKARVLMLLYIIFTISYPYESFEASKIGPMPTHIFVIEKFMIIL